LSRADEVTQRLSRQNSEACKCTGERRWRRSIKPKITDGRDASKEESSKIEYSGQKVQESPKNHISLTNLQTPSILEQSLNIEASKFTNLTPDTKTPLRSFKQSLNTKISKAPQPPNLIQLDETCLNYQESCGRQFDSMDDEMKWQEERDAVEEQRFLCIF
jgi:hypothetical protein